MTASRVLATGVAAVAIVLSQAAGGLDAEAQSESSRPQDSAPAVAPHPSAADILKSAIAALAGVESMQYEVREVGGYDVAGAKRPGHTTVVAARSPFRYSARFRTDDGALTEMAVSDGKTVHASDGGKVNQETARAILNSAAADALITGSLFDRDVYAAALASGNVLYAGRDDVDGDLCYVVAHGTLMAGETGSDTKYYWISAKTGLPRSYQAWRLLRGKTLLTLRWIVSNVQLNPLIPESTFTYVPTPADSTVTAKPDSGSAPRAAKVFEGVMLPDLQIRDATYEPISLTTLKGKATVLTFWAPWCGPCIGEMPIFKKLHDAYGGQLQIAAIAVKDSRLNVDQWIAKNPQYSFRFLMDADLGRSPTTLESFFDVEGIPVNVFLNSDGRIIARWLGFDGEAQLTAKVKALMSGVK